MVPRRHEPDYFGLTEEEQIAILRLVGEQQKRLREELSPEAFNIGVNAGPAAGQTVPHAHVHLIPRYEGDVADPRGGVRWVIPSRAPYWRDEADRTPPKLGPKAVRLVGWLATEVTVEETAGTPAPSFVFQVGSDGRLVRVHCRGMAASVIAALAGRAPLLGHPATVLGSLRPVVPSNEEQTQELESVDADVVFLEFPYGSHSWSDPRSRQE